jgi:alpha-L-fucosidase
MLSGILIRSESRIVHGDAPYDDFLDQWKASQFDASKLVKLFKEAGAEYIMPVTKHHVGLYQ